MPHAGTDLCCASKLPMIKHECLWCVLQVAAKKLDRRLAALGAVQLLERGLGDDQVSCCSLLVFC